MNKINLKKLKKPLKIIPKKFYDDRGFFQEIFLKKIFNLNIKFTAIAQSKKNVIRGLHFQLRNRQTKLIYVAEGKILDVVVNLRKNSKNFGKVSKFELKKGEMLFIPDHYGHGYECVSDKCLVFYHLERYRDAKNESGIKYNDQSLKIKWITKRPVLSLRDKSHISLEEFKKKFKSL